jgi:hypothetical protein
MRKCLVSIIWSRYGICSLLALSAGVRSDAEFFCTWTLPTPERNLCQGTRRETLRNIHRHLDNASAHNVKWAWQKITRAKAAKVVHPAYSPDVAPSDFFLFGCLKRGMAGFTAGSLEDILSRSTRSSQKSRKDSRGCLQQADDKTGVNNRA